MKSSFPGLSSIVDYDGVLKAELGGEEGVIVADVHIGHDEERKSEPNRYGKMWGIGMLLFGPCHRNGVRKVMQAILAEKKRLCQLSEVLTIFRPNKPIQPMPKSSTADGKR